MSTFVFSDTHLTTKFNQRKFNKLTQLIRQSDQVIINGDFWEGLIIKFDQFLNSRWKELFPLLKEKKAIYIYGNHDDDYFSDNRVFQFCDKATKEYYLETPKQKYFFTHGQHFLFPKQPKQYKLTPAPLKEEILHFIQFLAFTILGPFAYPNKFNDISLEERKALTSMENILVCGHTHRPEHRKSLNFIDLGAFNYGYANYMLIDKEGNFELKSEKY